MMQSVFVTGADKGLGLELVRRFASSGFRVFAGQYDRQSAIARQVGGSNLVVVPLDIADMSSVERAARTVASQTEGLDILINNAGVGLFVNAAEMSVDDWRQVIETNLSGVFYACHAAIPHLRRRGGGWIINISSLAGKNSFVGGAAYCASKAGLNAFSEVLMQEVRYDDIRVSYVMPGSVDTEFGGPGSPAKGGGWKLAAGDVAQVVIDLIEHPARSLPSRVEIRPAKPPKPRP